MPEPGPEGRPEPDQPRLAGECGGPRFTWVPGSAADGVELSGPVPPEALPRGQRTGAVPADLDWGVLLDALAASGLLDGDPEAQDAELADELAAEADGRMGPSMDPGRLAAMAVEYMEPGPALAGWLELAASAAPVLDEDGLTGLMVAARRQAAHAQQG